MTVSNNTTTAKGLIDFFTNPVTKRLDLFKKMVDNLSIKAERALEIGANVGTAFFSRSPKAELSSFFLLLVTNCTSDNLFKLLSS